MLQIVDDEDVFIFLKERLEENSTLGGAALDFSAGGVIDDFVAIQEVEAGDGDAEKCSSHFEQAVEILLIFSVVHVVAIQSFQTKTLGLLVGDFRILTLFFRHNIIPIPKFLQAYHFRASLSGKKWGKLPCSQTGRHSI